MPLRKDLSNTGESPDYDFSGWWVEQHVNEPADMTSLKTKKHDGWWFDVGESKVPGAALTDPSQTVETKEATEPETSQLEKYQAVLRQKFAETYKAQEKVAVKEEESDPDESDDYDSDASFQDLSSDSDGGD